MYSILNKKAMMPSKYMKESCHLIEVRFVIIVTCYVSGALCCPSCMVVYVNVPRCSMNVLLLRFHGAIRIC